MTYYHKLLEPYRNTLSTNSSKDEIAWEYLKALKNLDEEIGIYYIFNPNEINDSICLSIVSKLSRLDLAEKKGTEAGNKNYYMKITEEGIFAVENFNSISIYEKYIEEKIYKHNPIYGGSNDIGSIQASSINENFRAISSSHEQTTQVEIVDKNTLKKMSKKEVFVTYSWDNEQHDSKVLSFTNFLREKGFNAEMDKFHSQNETSIDFYKMMHQAMTDYDKVIVVLSTGYKLKADNFKGGVGNEYSLILKDIETQKNKYILVSFDAISDNITPLSFKGRQIINVLDENNFNDLFAKLKNEKTIEFSEVSNQKPLINKITIPRFESQKSNLEINLNVGISRSSMNAGKYTEIEYYLIIELNNVSNETISNYSLEILYPKNAIEYNIEGRIEGKYKIIQFDNPPKIYPSQTKSIDSPNLIIRSINEVTEILNDKIIIRIFTDNGSINKVFNLNNVLFVKSSYGFEKENLVSEMFQRRY